MSNLIKPFQIIMNLFSWIFLGAFIVVLVFTTVSNLNILGNYKTLIVQSGSMEPTIMTGDVILIATAQNYIKNDVVTFTDTDGGITTHRIIEIKTDTQKNIITKGDANRVQDSDLIEANQIMGKVVLNIPRLGYVINFIRSAMGTFIFLVIPAIFIVVDEIIHIIQATKDKKSSREN